MAGEIISIAAAPYAFAVRAPGEVVTRNASPTASTSTSGHTRDTYVTVIIDLTLVRDGTSRPRCWTWSKAAPSSVKTWLDQPSSTFRDGIDVVAIDGFTGVQTATAETVPEAVAVMGRVMWWRWPTTRWNEPATGSAGSCGQRAHRRLALRHRRVLCNEVDLLTDSLV